MNNAPENIQVEEMDKVYDVSRRRFFQFAGGLAGAGLLLSAASCRRTRDSDIYVGEGDTGLLNYLYIIKQVTAAFWTQAVATPYYNITKSESDLQPDLRDQEIAHREFLRSILAANGLGTVVTDLSPVTFADKTNFLNNAILLEDLTVAAYHGTLKLFASAEYIPVIAKMASVDARHASYVRHLLAHNTFGDGTAIDVNGLSMAVSPTTGMNTIGKYLQTKFDSSKLPTY